MAIEIDTKKVSARIRRRLQESRARAQGVADRSPAAKAAVKRLEPDFDKVEGNAAKYRKKAAQLEDLKERKRRHDMGI